MAGTQSKVTDYGYSDADPSDTYQDKAWLYDQYWRRDRYIRAIAEDCGVSFSTIQRWLDKHGIQRRTKGGVNAYLFMQTMDYDAMHREYVQERKSVYQIADEYDISHSLAQSQLDGHGIDRRTKTHAAKLRVPHCHLKTYERGYQYWVSRTGEHRDRMSVHRLAAVAEYGVEAVKGVDVHHANGIPWLNVPVFDADIPELENPNLVLADNVSHRRAHH